MTALFSWPTGTRGDAEGGGRWEPMSPTQAAWNTVARYATYEQAQAAVDRLSDDGFPVDRLDIVGSDLQMVERITGRLTKARAATAGAASGAWLGVLLGLLLGLFTTGHTALLTMIVLGAVIGAAWGALLGWFAHAATRGQRDFASVRAIAAARFDLVARGGTAERARGLLAGAGMLAPTGSAGTAAYDLGGQGRGQGLSKQSFTGES